MTDIEEPDMHTESNLVDCLREDIIENYDVDEILKNGKAFIQITFNFFRSNLLKYHV